MFIRGGVFEKPQVSHIKDRTIYKELLIVSPLTLQDGFVRIN